MKDWRSEGTKRHESEARTELTGDGAQALESSGRCHYGSPCCSVTHAGEWILTGVGTLSVELDLVTEQDAEKFRHAC